MSLAFTFLAGTRLYLDPRGRVPVTLVNDTSLTVLGISTNQELSELISGNCDPAVMRDHRSSLAYTETGTDNTILPGAAGTPFDEGSSSVSRSPSASVSLSPSASVSLSPSSSQSRSPSSSLSSSPSSSVSRSISRSPSAS